MFSGIVQGKLLVKNVLKSADFQSLLIGFNSQFLDNLELGASVAVNGVCLTVAGIDQDLVKFDVIDETLGLTNLGELQAGDLVNIERSLRYGDELGGHPLSGHIDCTSQVLAITESTDNYQIKVAIPQQIKKFIFLKGYIGFNGASLTINNLTTDSFTVNLIPETLRLTNLGNLQAGDLVNLEIDRGTQVIVETVERVLEKKEQK